MSCVDANGREIQVGDTVEHIHVWINDPKAPGYAKQFEGKPYLSPFLGHATVRHVIAHCAQVDGTGARTIPVHGGSFLRVVTP